MSETKHKDVPCTEIAKECITQNDNGTYVLEHNKLIKLLPESIYLSFLDWIDKVAPDNATKDSLYGLIKNDKISVKCSDD